MGFEVDAQRWAWWPEREDLSIEFTRLLGAAQEGGATVAECCVAASRIDPGDDRSWYREWKRVADVNCERGNAARDNGHMLTAKSNWLRAIGYYQSAAFPFDHDDEDHRAAIESMRRCARDYLQHRNPAGEVVQIPWPGGYPLEAYFLPAPATAGPVPAIICIGEPGQRKEEYLYKVARHGGRYERTLELFRRARRAEPRLLTKSGIILGLGEERAELLDTMRDLREADVNILTLGQYLRPSAQHLPVARYYTPDEFAELGLAGRALGFAHVESGPLVRSSYHAKRQVDGVTSGRGR